MNTQVQEKPVTESAMTQSVNETHQSAATQTKPTDKRTWVEEVEVAGNQLVDRIKELVQESNTRRVIVRAEDNREIFTVPLTAGVVVGGLITLTLPMLAALGAVAALVSRVKLEVIREEEPMSEEKPAPEKK